MKVNCRFVWATMLSLAIFSGSKTIVPTGQDQMFTSATAATLSTLTVQSPSGQEYALTVGASQLPTMTVKTHTPWSEGLIEFSGVPLKTLLAAAGVDEKTLRRSTIKARALNDYEVEIPGQDAYEYDVLVADRMNGELMPVTEFGPFWIIYPRDDRPELQDSRFDHRWVWQLSELRVE